MRSGEEDLQMMLRAFVEMSELRVTHTTALERVRACRRRRHRLRRGGRYTSSECGSGLSTSASYKRHRRRLTLTETHSFSVRRVRKFVGCHTTDRNVCVFPSCHTHTHTHAHLVLTPRSK